MSVFWFVFLVVIASQFVAMYKRPRMAARDGSGPRTGACHRHGQGVSPVAPELFPVALDTALRGVPARVVEPRGVGRIVAVTPYGMFTSGSIITVWFGPAPGGTGFTVESRPRQWLLYYDWGRNQRNVDRLVALLQSPVVAVPSGPAPQWAGDPSGRHQQRYWDGARWTEHVSDGGVTSVDPPPSTRRVPGPGHGLG
jgi:hypothetical protein